jgi:hypothetical protein
MQRVSSRASDRRHSSQKALARNVIGGSIALACVPLACAWFLLHDSFGGRVDPVITARLKAPNAPVAAARPAAPTAPVADAQEQAPTFSLASASSTPVVLARKNVVGPPIAVPPQAASADPIMVTQSTALTGPNVSVAMLDITSSIGVPPASFSTRPLAQAENRFTAPPPPQATAPQTTAAVTQDAARPVPVRRPVQTASLAPMRPAEVKPAQNPNPLIDPKAAKNKVLSNTAVLKIFEKILGKPQDQQPSSALAYASPDGGVLSDGESPTLGRTGPLIDEFTAVYDISAGAVYLPDGTKLEAHSGLGPMKDNPQHVDKRMRGATPPHVYDLKLREALFHGVRAIRLNPIGGERAIFGRNGILAHTYMLGPRGDSNGCVSFKDYNAFLQAYLRGDIKRMAVVARLD